MNIKSVELSNLMTLHLLNTDKFKTVSLMVYLQCSLDENAALNALVPSVLKRSNINFKSSDELDIYLEDMYGAAFDVSVIKKGDIQSSVLILQFISDRYAKEKVFKKAIDLMRDMLLLPYKNNTGFKKEDVEIEKKKQREIIKSRSNDKVHYAAERCLEIMCKGEPFEIYRYGSLSELDKIDEKICFDHYVHMLKTCPVDMFIIGDFDEEYSIKYIKNALSIDERSPVSLGHITKHDSVIPPRVVNENMDVSQGRLCAGYSTGVSLAEKDYPALSVYTGILGGGLNSKLFKTLREREGLAYYTYAGVEKFKGLMIINSGIEPDKYDKALSIIREQIDEMYNGNISEEELNICKKSIEGDLKSINDNGQLLADYFLGGWLYDTIVSPEDMANMINNVRIEDVKKVAQNIKMDTVYFLRPTHEVIANE